MGDSHQQPDGWPCVLSEEVASLLMDPAIPPEVFGAVVAAAVLINETRGEVPGATATAKWPEQRRMPLGPDGAYGVAEYVVVAHAEPPQIVLTRVQLY
ncbi:MULTISPECIES: hypothetical protein [unclassified Streptomyces]|uniref:hypothetical protein n=1 Tax=unclassified Streptomyces TaxID=2593676 RepID=UPI0036EE222F